MLTRGGRENCIPVFEVRHACRARPVVRSNLEGRAAPDGLTSGPHFTTTPCHRSSRAEEPAEDNCRPFPELEDSPSESRRGMPFMSLPPVRATVDEERPLL